MALGALQVLLTQSLGMYRAAATPVQEARWGGAGRRRKEVNREGMGCPAGGKGSAQT